MSIHHRSPYESPYFIFRALRWKPLQTSTNTGSVSVRFTLIGLITKPLSVVDPLPPNNHCSIFPRHHHPIFILGLNAKKTTPNTQKPHPQRTSISDYSVQQKHSPNRLLPLFSLSLSLPLLSFVHCAFGRLSLGHLSLNSASQWLGRPLAPGSSSPPNEDGRRFGDAGAAPWGGDGVRWVAGRLGARRLGVFGLGCQWGIGTLGEVEDGGRWSGLRSCGWRSCGCCSIF